MHPPHTDVHTSELQSSGPTQHLYLIGGNNSRDWLDTVDIFTVSMHAALSEAFSSLPLSFLSLHDKAPITAIHAHNHHAVPHRSRQKPQSLMSRSLRPTSQLC